MKPVALAKSREHLDTIKGAADRLNLRDGFKAYESAWSDVLAHASRIYGKLEQGAKGCNASEPWFGNRKKERKDDPLLSYLLHARNSDEHSLDYITQRGADALTIGFPPTTSLKTSFDMMIDDKGGMHIRNTQVESPNGGINRVEAINPRVELVAVRDRGITYDPPTAHGGQDVHDASPIGIASLAIEYLEAMLEDASRLPPS